MATSNRTRAGCCRRRSVAPKRASADLKSLSVVLALVVSSISCGSGPTAPPAVVTLAGTWSGTVTLVSVGGGECFAPGFVSLVGVPIGVNPIPISQTGANATMKLSLLYPSTDCTYDGI